MNQLLIDGTNPEWLAQGETVLIMKDPQKEVISSNYRLITCLGTTWKLLWHHCCYNEEAHGSIHEIARKKLVVTPEEPSTSY